MFELNGPRTGALTASQNSCNFSTRFSGGFPAIKAGVDRADRNAGYPVGMQVCLSKCLIDASLVGAEGAATLQHEGNSFERRTLFDIVEFEPVRHGGPIFLKMIA